MDEHFAHGEKGLVPPADRWPLRGDAPCLDFANTVGWRPLAHPVDVLREYADLIAWGLHAELLSRREAERLLKNAVVGDGDARAALCRAVVLREAIYRLFAALAHGREIEDADLSMINATMVEGVARSELVREQGGFAVRNADDEDALDLPLWRLAASAAQLLTSGEWRRVRECPGHDCGWLFLDTTKNGNRRWCDSADCGNRARVRAHYHRQHAVTSLN